VYAIPQSELQQPSSDLVVKLTGHFAVAGAPDVKPELIRGITRSAYNIAHSRAAAVRARSASLGGAAAVENVIELLKQEELLACFALTEDFADEAEVGKLAHAAHALHDPAAKARLDELVEQALRHDQPAKERRAWRKYQNLLGDLGKIADTMQTSRGSRAKRKGRPPKRDLDRVVGCLAMCWEAIVGPDTFTAKWETRTRRPLTPAAAFVHDIVEFIDSARLPEVRKAMERVIRARKQHPHTPR
jgi:hypothetical protein